jgi:hypothetical protein
MSTFQHVFVKTTNPAMLTTAAPKSSGWSTGPWNIRYVAPSTTTATPAVSAVENASTA